MRKAAMIMILISILFLNACGKGKTYENKSEAQDLWGKDYKIAMITDTGGINDQSFNQGAWEGLQKLSKDTGAVTNYIQSKQASDFVMNFEMLVDSGNQLCWGIGYACADAVLESANKNPTTNFAIIDNAYENTPTNVTGVMFDGQEPSFLVGYIAASVSKTNLVGFVGGIDSAIIDQFLYGYLAGVDYANKTQEKNVEVSVQYAESFSDAAKGKSIAEKMYLKGCDVVFHAAGGTGTGVIEAAKENGKFVIGADRDQAYLAPENVLTSALKNVNVVVEEISIKYMKGETIGGKTFTFGLADNAVGIPEEHSLYSDEVYESAMAIKKEIIEGRIKVPSNKQEYEEYLRIIEK